VVHHTGPWVRAWSAVTVGGLAVYICRDSSVVIQLPLALMKLYLYNGEYRASSQARCSACVSSLHGCM
jgi:hypothetical protein